MLRVENLTKCFGGLVAVDNLSFEVKRGEILGLIGPNGAGKTTVFNLVTGFLRPTKGKIIFKDRNIVGLKPHSIASLGLVRTFQASTLFRGKTTFENVIVAHHLQQKAGFLSVALNTQRNQLETKKAVDHSEQILERVGLTHLRDAPAESLPHGFQRSLGVAIALATTPELLMLDEPITGMTYHETEAVMRLIQELNKGGLTILLVEHNVRAVLRICQRVIVLNFGKKLAEGLPQEVRNNKEVIEAYLGT